MNFTDRHMRYVNSDDVSLVREISSGRSEALMVLTGRYMSLVSRTAYRILCDLPDSEDVTVAVFRHVWDKASCFDFHSDVRLWIYGITCDVCYEHLGKRRLLDLLSLRPSLYEISAPRPESPEEDFITKETWAIYCRAAGGLSSKERTVFTLRELEDLSAEETSSVTGLSPEQVNSNLREARKKIKEELERYGKVR